MHSFYSVPPIRRALLLFGCLFALSSLEVHAQLPGTISYQGQILGEDAAPVVDGTYQVTVALYDQEFGATPIWQETHTTRFTGGLFTIYLGSIRPFNLSFDRQYWLGVSFDGKAEMAARMPLASTPYAIRSEVAGELEGGAVSSINGEQGDLKIVGSGGTLVTERDGVITIASTTPKGLQADGKVDLSPNSAQSSTDGYTLIHINEEATGDPDLIDLEVDGEDRFHVDNDGNMTIAGDLTVDGATISGSVILGDGTGTSDVTINPGSGIVDFEGARLTDLAQPTGSNDAATKAYVDQAESDAKAYSDLQDAAQSSTLQSYADNAASMAETSARSYADAQIAIMRSNLEAYADQAEADARAYADQQDASMRAQLEAAIAQGDTDVRAYAENLDAQLRANLEAYADQAEADARAYVDQQSTLLEASLKAYTDQAVADARQYSDDQDAAQTTSLETYADNAATTAETNAKNYADAGDAATLSSAQSYADQAEADANAYTDAQDAAQNITGEPLVTFEVGSPKLTDNRVLTAGTGVTFSDANVDNGSMTVAIGQDVAPAAAPTFSGMELTGMQSTTTTTNVVVSNAGTLQTRSAASLSSEFNDDYWQTGGNAGLSGSNRNLGTTDNAELSLVVGGGELNGLHFLNNGALKRTRFAEQTGAPRRATGSIDLQPYRDATNQGTHGEYSIVAAGRFNRTGGSHAVVSGGERNTANGAYSAVIGGSGLTLEGSGSAGFLGNNSNGTNNMTVSAANTVLFGNTDLWLANNDGDASELRFYESNSASGTFPGGTSYTSLSAGNQSENIQYTLPTTRPSADNQILASTTGGAMSWVDNGVTTLSAGDGIAVDRSTGGVTVSNTGVRTISGRNGHVIVDQSTGDVEVSLPQRVDEGAVPTFEALRLTSIPIESSSSEIVVMDNGELSSRTVSSVVTEMSDDFWTTSGNSGIGQNRYIGTTDDKAVQILVNQGKRNGLALMTNGAIRRSLVESSVGGDRRGERAVDLQIQRASTDQAGSGDYSVITGGENNKASGSHATVAGGRANSATGTMASVLGGGDNTAGGNFSAVIGGRQMTVDGNRSLGFLAGSTPTDPKPMRVFASDVAAFGNADIWLANNNGSASQLRFYEPNSATGDFPTDENGTIGSSTVHHTSFSAGNQSGNINYTLPTGLPTGTSRRYMSTDRNGVMRWGSFQGTNNQIDVAVNSNNGNITFSLPQNVDENATPSFNGINLDDIQSGGSGKLLILGSNNDVRYRTVSTIVPQEIGTDATPTFDGLKLDDLTTGGSENLLILAGDKSVEYRTASSIFPQEIGTDATPTFNSVRLDNLQTMNGSTRIIVAGTQGKLGERDLSSLSSAFNSDFWRVGGNSGATDVFRDYIGTSDDNPLALYVDGGAANSLILGTNGSLYRLSSVAASPSTGDLRGIDAVDLQTRRSSSEMVASGKASVITGGAGNTASGDFSSVLGGKENTASGDRSVVLGGEKVTVSGANSMAFGARAGVSAGSPASYTLTDDNTVAFVNTDIRIDNNSGKAGSLRFYSSSGSSFYHYSQFKASAQASNIEYQLPSLLPGSGQTGYMSVNSSGGMKWSRNIVLDPGVSSSSSTIKSALEVSTGAIVLGHSAMEAYGSSQSTRPTMSNAYPMVVITDTRYSGTNYWVKTPSTGLKGQTILVVNRTNKSVRIDQVLNPHNNTYITVDKYSVVRLIAVQAEGSLTQLSWIAIRD